MTDPEKLRAMADEVGVRKVDGEYVGDVLLRMADVQEKLPKCWRLNEAGVLVQDVTVVPGMLVHVPYTKMIEERLVAMCMETLDYDNEWTSDLEKAYFTKQAAEASRGGL